MKKLALSQAIEGFLLDAAARRLSPKTLETYKYIFAKLTAYFAADPPIAAITTTQIKTFLSSHPELSNSTIRHIHAAMSAVWQWAYTEGLIKANIIRTIASPRPNSRVIEPFTRDEVKALLSALSHSRFYTRPGKRESNHSLPLATRNKAIILILLDTGIRATELCQMRIADLDIKHNQILVHGKGAKDRLIPISPSTAKAAWYYLKDRPDAAETDPLFPSNSAGGHLEPNALNHIIHTIAERAGVENAHPHKFRHTFAINYLRNGGDVFTLQRCLGHSTLEMVRRYLAIAQVDLENAHKQASPVANWRL